MSSGRALAAAAFALSAIVVAPVTALACAAGGAGVAGAGQAGSLGSFDFHGVTYVAMAAFLVLAGQLAIPLVVTMRRRQRKVTPQLSPDGLYWWDGRVWRPRPGPG